MQIDCAMILARKDLCMSDKKNRFVKTYSQGKLEQMEIWVDTKTGVNYLYHHAGYSGGLTPLLDAEGKPVITPVKEL